MACVSKPRRNLRSKFRVDRLRPTPISDISRETRVLACTHPACTCSAGELIRSLKTDFRELRFWRKVVTQRANRVSGLQVPNGQCVLIGPLQWAILRKYRLAFLQMRCKSLARVCSGEAENLKRG